MDWMSLKVNLFELYFVSFLFFQDVVSTQRVDGNSKTLNYVRWEIKKRNPTPWLELTKEETLAYLLMVIADNPLIEFGKHLHIHISDV